MDTLLYSTNLHGLMVLVLVNALIVSCLAVAWFSGPAPSETKRLFSWLTLAVLTLFVAVCLYAILVPTGW